MSRTRLPVGEVRGMRIPSPGKRGSLRKRVTCANGPSGSPQSQSRASSSAVGFRATSSSAVGFRAEVTDVTCKCACKWCREIDSVRADERTCKRIGKQSERTVQAERSPKRTGSRLPEADSSAHRVGEQR